MSNCPQSMVYNFHGEWSNCVLEIRYYCNITSLVLLSSILEWSIFMVGMNGYNELDKYPLKTEAELKWDVNISADDKIVAV